MRIPPLKCCWHGWCYRAGVKHNRKENDMATKMSSTVRTGSVLEDFSLISYDEDMGRMLVRKAFEDGSEWLEPIAITIPDLFFLFKEEGVDPSENISGSRFEFRKAKIKVEHYSSMFDDDMSEYDSGQYYWACEAVRN